MLLLPLLLHAVRAAVSPLHHHVLVVRIGGHVSLGVAHVAVIPALGVPLLYDWGRARHEKPSQHILGLYAAANGVALEGLVRQVQCGLHALLFPFKSDKPEIK